MLLRTNNLSLPSLSPLHNPNPSRFHHTLIRFRGASPPRSLSAAAPILRRNPADLRKICVERLVRACVSIGQENDGGLVEEEREERESIWEQMKEIVTFTGPAAGLWICGPLMSLIDTIVIGQGSSVELAALGPGTVLCDHMSYIFMFLSVATSNLVATSLAKQDKDEAQHQISVLLFIGLACGLLMLLFTKLFGTWAVTAFTRGKNIDIVPAANTYIQIRALAWPAILVGLVAQSASLGMKNSWGPLKALAAATVINGLGDIILCLFFGQGIAGAAWATAVSQIVSAYMMMDSLNKEGYNAFAFAVPSTQELWRISALAAPVLVSIFSKVAFYSFIIYCATSMGTHVLAAHQVMAQMFRMCNVWGEPLSQTAQSFMPELLYGVKRNLSKARTLLKSLMIIGATLGVVLGVIGASVPGLFPGIYTRDGIVIHEMHRVLIPFFLALSAMPSAVSLEGTLLAGRDLKFVSSVMSASFVLGCLILTLVTRNGFGLVGCWFVLVGFQWGRFLLYLGRLLSPDGLLYSHTFNQYTMEKI
ncbi:PREDICTED: protein DETOXIFICATION 47, chloroplastic [Tarenaya hassleriana]|uniref:protein DETOXIFICATION 47, chloroplastic n=1 Tax=Tarenaya hassleriana TaxID=28532 RepID=UPI00053C51F3|nr:PREDICTED: protein DETOXIFICATION 47, chloroplastic [Tarenaya hassleriana]